MHHLEIPDAAFITFESPSTPRTEFESPDRQYHFVLSIDPPPSAETKAAKATTSATRVRHAIMADEAGARRTF